MRVASLQLSSVLYIANLYASGSADIDYYTLIDDCYLFGIMIRQEFVPVATGPWPTFIVARSARTDNERLPILCIFDQMDKVWSIGNLRIIRTILEAIWKQRNLQEIPDTLRRSNGGFGPRAASEFLGLCDATAIE